MTNSYRDQIFKDAERDFLAISRRLFAICPPTLGREAFESMVLSLLGQVPHTGLDDYAKERLFECQRRALKTALDEHYGVEA